jgi:zinc/manganese transport system permease protein
MNPFLAWLDLLPWFVAPLVAVAAGCVALAPLGEQVLARGVVFIDLAVAQGAAAAALWVAAWIDHPGFATVQAATLAGALASAAAVAYLARRAPAAREALIGLVYVAGASAAILGARADPHGGERLSALLAADVLWAGWPQALMLAGVAAAMFALRRPYRRALLARDAVFYPCFALVASAAVPVLGLFVVFAGLIAPALWIQAGTRAAAAVGGAVAAATAGIAASWWLDGPSGACVALSLAAMGIASAVRRRRHGAHVGGDAVL